MAESTRRWLECPACKRQFSVGPTTTRLYCSPECTQAARRKNVPLVFADGLPTGTAGALAELLVCADLMKRGFHVFRAVGPHGPCDVVAFRRGEACLKIEVTTATIVTSGKSYHPPKKTPRHEFDVLALVTGHTITYVPELVGP